MNCSLEQYIILMLPKRMALITLVIITFASLNLGLQVGDFYPDIGEDIDIIYGSKFERLGTAAHVHHWVNLRTPLNIASEVTLYNTIMTLYRVFHNDHGIISSPTILSTTYYKNVLSQVVSHYKLPDSFMVEGKPSGLVKRIYQWMKGNGTFPYLSKAALKARLAEYFSGELDDEVLDEDDPPKNGIFDRSFDSLDSTVLMNNGFDGDVDLGHLSDLEDMESDGDEHDEDYNNDNITSTTTTTEASTTEASTTTTERRGILRQPLLNIPVGQNLNRGLPADSRPGMTRPIFRRSYGIDPRERRDTDGYHYLQDRVEFLHADKSETSALKALIAAVDGGAGPLRHYVKRAFPSWKARVNNVIFEHNSNAIPGIYKTFSKTSSADHDMYLGVPTSVPDEIRSFLRKSMETHARHDDEVALRLVMIRPEVTRALTQYISMALRRMQDMLNGRASSHFPLLTFEMGQNQLWNSFQTNSSLNEPLPLKEFNPDEISQIPYTIVGNDDFQITLIFHFPISDKETSAILKYDNGENQIKNGDEIYQLKYFPNSYLLLNHSLNPPRTIANYRHLKELCPIIHRKYYCTQSHFPRNVDACLINLFKDSDQSFYTCKGNITRLDRPQPVRVGMNRYQYFPAVRSSLFINCRGNNYQQVMEGKADVQLNHTCPSALVDDYQVHYRPSICGGKRQKCFDLADNIFGTEQIRDFMTYLKNHPAVITIQIKVPFSLSFIDEYGREIRYGAMIGVPVVMAIIFLMILIKCRKRFRRNGLTRLRRASDDRGIAMSQLIHHHTQEDPPAYSHRGAEVLADATDPVHKRRDSPRRDPDADSSQPILTADLRIRT